MTLAPEGAFATSGARSGFTRGIEVGEAAAGGRDLRTATRGLLESLGQANPNLSQLSGFQSTNVDNRNGLRVDLANTSDATEEPERIALYTTLLPDGHMFYAVAVAPRQEFCAYEPTFARVIGSLRLENHQ